MSTSPIKSTLLPNTPSYPSYPHSYQTPSPISPPSYPANSPLPYFIQIHVTDDHTIYALRNDGAIFKRLHGETWKEIPLPETGK